MAYSFTPPPILYLFNIYTSCFYIFANSALHKRSIENAQTMSIRTTSAQTMKKRGKEAEPATAKGPIHDNITS